LSSFSLTSNMCTGTERDVALSKRCDFGKSQPSLHCGQQQSMITTSQPSVGIGGCQQLLDFWSSQKVHQRAQLPLVGNSQHALDESRALRDFKCGVAKE